MKKLNNCLHVKNVRLILAVLLVSGAVTLTACKQNVVEVGSSSSDVASETTTEVSSTGVQKENPIVIDESVATETTVNDSSTTAETESSVADTTVPPAVITAPGAASSTATRPIANTARSLIGSPFKSNSASPESGFDNSGLIWYVLTENAYKQVPRGISEQAKFGTEVAWGDIKTGDLLFFGEDGKLQFGGIATVDGHMVYAANPEENVLEADISTPYWEKSFVTARRVG